MKKLIAVILTLISITLVSQNAQARIIELVKGERKDSDLAGDYRVDFAVPDVPAFSIIGADPSNILRPSSERELFVVASNFIGPENSFNIPKDFAVEFSPLLLAEGKDLKLEKYKASPWLYRLRVSAATRRETVESAPTEIGFGLRVNVIDESDLRTDDTYVKNATEIAGKINAVYVMARKRTGPPPAKIVFSPDEQKVLNELDAELKERWADQKWNAQTLDFAVASHASASDAMGNDLKMQKYAGWATFGTGFGTWGQLLIGANGTVEQDTEGDEKLDVLSYSFSTRLYIGSNPYKMFIETQGAAKEGKSPNWLLNAGGEVKLQWGTWLAFSSGLEWVRETKTANLVTTFKLKVGLPTS